LTPSNPNTNDVIRRCDRFPGAAVTDKIAACIADLPPTGGTADARGFEGNEIWNSCPASTPARPVRLYLGAGTIRLAADCAFPVSLSLDLGPGSIIDSNGHVLTIGSMTATSEKHFAGTVRFSANVGAMNPVWWGADPTATVDSHDAFAATISAAVVSGLRGPEIVCPGGTYLLGSTLVIGGAYGLRFGGQGWNCKIQWNGDNMTPALQLASCYRCDIGGFSLVFVSGNPGRIAMDIRNGNPVGVGSTANHIHDIWINADGGYLVDGIRTSGLDSNNDFMSFDRVKVSGATHSCWDLQGSQSYSHVMHDSMCGPGGGVLPDYGVIAEAAGGGQGNIASFSWYGGGFGTNLWDFYLDGVTDSPFVISGIDDESFGGLLYSNGGTIVHVTGARWVRDGKSPRTDSRVVFARNTLLVIDKSSIECFGGIRYSCTIDFSPLPSSSGALGQLVMRDDRILTNNLSYGLLFAGPTTPILDNVAWQDPGGGGASHSTSTGNFTPRASTGGTVTMTHNSNLVVGAGTSFSGAMVGGFLRVERNGVPGVSVWTISTVLDSTHLTLSEPYYYSDAATTPYLVGYGAAVAEFQDLLASSATFDKDVTVGPSQDSGAKLTVPRYTVAHLPSPAGKPGMMAYVLDSNTTSWGEVVVGGGTKVVLVWSNGTSWTVVGK
jgi:hypothetical protein